MMEAPEIAADAWLDVVRREYLRDFVRPGGAAVKFVAASDEPGRSRVRDGLGLAARNEGFLFASVDSAYTKVHMIDKLFHEVANQIDWDELTGRFVRTVLSENGYEPVPDASPLTLSEIASANGRDEARLRNELRGLFENVVFRDSAMSQEFRIAMLNLCMGRLLPEEAFLYPVDAIRKWLSGTLERVSALRQAPIFQRIARHNARHMLFSLVHWLRLAGHGGLVLCLDITRCTDSSSRRPPGGGFLTPERKEESPTRDLTRGAPPEGGFRYSVPSAMDAYEVLRQFIDSTDEMEGCFIVALSSREFLSDEKRGVNCYQALKLRIWDEVHDRRLANPFSPLVRLARSAEEPQPGPPLEDL